MSSPAQRHSAAKARGGRTALGEFAAGYEAQRRPADPHGYHAMIDDLEVGITERYARGKDLLEVGCGTGLLLERFRSFARSLAIRRS